MTSHKEAWMMWCEPINQIVLMFPLQLSTTTLSCESSSPQLEVGGRDRLS